MEEWLIPFFRALFDSSELFKLGGDIRWVTRQSSAERTARNGFG